MNGVTRTAPSEKGIPGAISRGSIPNVRFAPDEPGK